MRGNNRDKILLTGGAGFVGSQVAQAYFQVGHEVIVGDDFSRGKREHLPKGVRVYQVDIYHLDSLNEIFIRERPTIVNHPAALVGVRESYQHPEPYWQVNLQGALNVSVAALKTGVDKLIYASSGGAIYGETQLLPISESDPTDPISPYGESKLAGEKLLWRQDGNLETVVLRYANVSGPVQDPLQNNVVIAIFAHALMNRDQPVIYGDGLQTRDYIHIHNVVEANLTALKPDVKGVFNIVTEQGHTLRQVYQEIADKLVVDGVAPAYLPANRYEVLHNILDIGRAKDTLGWQPRISFDAGLRETIQTIMEERSGKHVSL